MTEAGARLSVRTPALRRYLRCLFPVTQPPTKPAAAAKTATHFEIEEVVESFIEARERGVSGDAGPSSAPGPSNRLQTSGASLSSPGARSNSGGAGASSGAGGSSMETGMEPATASTAKSRAEISNKLTKLMVRSCCEARPLRASACLIARSLSRKLPLTALCNRPRPLQTPLSYDAFYNNMRAAKKACEVNCSEVLHARGSRVLDLIRNGVDRDTVRAAGRWTENGDAFELNYANEFPPDAILGCAQPSSPSRASLRSACLGVIRKFSPQTLPSSGLSGLPLTQARASTTRPPPRHTALRERSKSRTR